MCIPLPALTAVLPVASVKPVQAFHLTVAAGACLGHPYSCKGSALVNCGGLLSSLCAVQAAFVTNSKLFDARDTKKSGAFKLGFFGL